MATALQETKSLQERINELHIQLTAANEEQQKDVINLIEQDEDCKLKKKKPEGGLSFGIPPPRSGRPALNLNLREKRKSERTAAIERQLKELTKKAAILAIDGEKYPFTIEDLEWIEEIGSGTCGVVNKMYHRATNTTMAVKIMGRTPIMEEQKRILMDLDVITKCNDCPYIVQCFGLFISQSDVYVCMEIMGTCLEKLLRTTRTPVPEPILGKISLSVVKALQYLKQEHGVMHRDIKPSNILLDDKGNVKLCDFGISGRLVDSKAKTKGAGCAAYMAPERVEPPDPLNPDYDVRADVWSLGISLVELATGSFPYRGCFSEFEVLMKIVHDEAPCLPPNQGFSEEFQSFIKACLEKDRVNRPKFDVLLKHPFLRRYEREPVDVVGWYSNVTTYV
ncbi:dual specificity mitogen-activated protein kinase kinase 7-like [Hydractinia symbiolongicarpus]|uniref:dual specificity mitogen-activated protein kinase kinase 7-like n=1 Tax=Hydractinia symbiolongicarpus TaxID=13093 RepID=UPI00254ABA55|nr:dual specificity mitogen-activated protein kinase kinase 7-like [Hydractinia symbiolongicarpus]